MNTGLMKGVVGHEQAIDLLSRAIAAQQIPQSLLVTGVPQVGKTTLAQVFAMAVNCRGADPPCWQCFACRKIEERLHPDVFIFENTEDTIKIDQVRTLQHDLALKPHEGRYKIAILCDFERATLAAANALLKTLEEPPRHAILILTAQYAANLLPTIVSRCQILKLKPVDRAKIGHFLQTSWQAAADEAALLSKLSAGRPGWAVDALANPDLLARRSQYLADLVEILARPEAFRLAYVQNFLKSQQPVGEILNLWLTWWRDVLLLHHSLVDGMVNVDLLESLAQFAHRLSLEQIVETIHQLDAALKNLKYNVNARLNLEVLLLNLPLLPTASPASP